VVKADGLAAGKGAVVCRDLAEAAHAIGEMLERRVFGDAGARVVVEELLEGEEISVFALTDGRAVCPLASAQDHKAVFDGDRGPNTGGMGAYSPAPALDPTAARHVTEAVLLPTIRGMAAEGRPYRGVLFAGLMLTPAGLRVLEYNVRFGDPECQALMLRLVDDLLPLCQAVAEGRGLPPSVAWRPEAAACVVLASGGYPGEYATGIPIEGIERAEAQAGVTVFHAGTARRDGHLVTAGGRVLGVTALGADIRAAVTAAYAAAREVRFDGVHYRRDIGHRALGRP
jgi:phosphoribosylamine--glycine ligase